MTPETHAAGPEATLRDIAARLPVVRNARKKTIWYACWAIGLAAFLYLLVTQPARAWGAYAINTVYWLGMAQGAVVLACAIRLANGRWAGPIMRIAESLSAFLPWGMGLMGVLLAFGIWTYLPWVRDGAEPRQAAFLNVPFLYIRTALGLGLLWWLSRDLVRLSLRTDARLLKPFVASGLEPDYEKLSQGWRGDEAEATWQRDRLSIRAPQIVVLYAVVYTLIAWDFVMGLTPNWVSTLFGWWFFMGAFLSGIAMTAFLATQVRTKLQLERWIDSSHFWDVGKIAFGFSIFWVYQFWSQYLPIWYANLPEETWWVFLRFEEPWRGYGFAVFGFVFLLPFLGLMNIHTKKNPFWLATFCMIIMFGMWLERHVLVMPSLNPEVPWVGLPEVGVTIGFLGVFGWAVQGFLTKYPAIKVTDALAPPHGPPH